ncbi:MAG: NUDIX domain-containing protein [Actinobacteria bacterium]|nr:NUDIX domain-containing protein [Actinomycetota bacterium]
MTDPIDQEAAYRSFIARLNERLPTKRVIAQGTLCNERGEVLLCELTYKREWDLPGGVVDTFESPAACLAREVAEELGTAVQVGELLTTTWLPPYRGWDDAVLFLFDLGRVPSAWVEGLILQVREIVAVHWVAVEDLDNHVAPYAARLLRAALTPAPRAYLEDGLPPVSADD